MPSNTEKGTTGLGELDPNQLPLDLFEFNQSTKVISLKDGYKFSHAVLADDATHADDADHATTADTATNATNAGNADTLDNAHADVAPAAGEIPILDGAGLGAFGISGNAATADAADYATEAGDADTVDGAHASVTPGAGEIPILNGSGDGAFDITGNAATATNADDAAVAAAVTLADEAADTTCFPVFAPAATGDQALKTDTGYTYDPTTGVLGALGLLMTAGGTVGNVYAGVLNSNVLSSSNANQYFDLVTVYFIRIMDIVFVFASMRFRSNAGTGTQAGNIWLTPPANIAIGAGTSTSISPGLVWRSGGSITSDNEWTKFVPASSRIDTQGTLDSTEAGLVYGGIWAYTMAAS